MTSLSCQIITVVLCLLTATELPSPNFKLGRRGSTFSSMRLSQKASSNHQVRRNTTRVRGRSYKEKKVNKRYLLSSSKKGKEIAKRKLFLFSASCISLCRALAHPTFSRCRQQRSTITTALTVNISRRQRRAQRPKQSSRQLHPRPSTKSREQMRSDCRPPKSATSVNFHARRPSSLSESQIRLSG